MDIRALMIYTVNNQMDLKEYMTNELINKTNINKFYGLDKTEFPSYVKEIMNRTRNSYK